MELIYLWVEDYKNIKEQGFNFSGRYRCEYDKEKNELTIEENKEYVHIFPDNINVTAIVGKNGSGKSSVLVGLTNHKIAIEKNNKFLSSDFSGVYIQQHNRNEDYKIIYIDFDLIKITQIRCHWDFLGHNIFDQNLYNRIENESVFNKIFNKTFNILQFRRNFFNIIIKHQESFDAKLFLFNPSKIILSDYIQGIDLKDSKLVHANKLIEDVQHNNLSKEKFLVFIYSTLKNQSDLELPDIEQPQDLTALEASLLEYSQYAKIDSFQYLYDFFDALNNLEDKKHISIDDFMPTYHNHKDAFLKLIEIGYLKINFADELGREYDDLSQGERKLFTELLMLHDAIVATDKQDIFVVLDEPDLALHPEWQRKYINEIINLLSKHSKNFHLIITSHSPFILSDIPKDNIVFLENGKQVNANIDTFGANIHTLLTHGFFMEDGLMGEYAKTKINKAIELLNKKGKLSKSSMKYCEKIISIIGEPIIKKQLQRMLDSKRLSKIDEIDLLKAQMSEIEKKLKKLENSK